MTMEKYKQKDPRDQYEIAKTEPERMDDELKDRQERKKRRSAAIVLHISSLPGEEGIGTFGEEAYQFVDFLSRARQRFWQILPLGPTSFGDSPYQSFSSFAGNPYFISIKTLEVEGLIDPAFLQGADLNRTPDSVDFEKIYTEKYRLLRQSYRKGYDHYRGAIDEFVEANRYWLPDYALFMAIKDEEGGKPWWKWPKELRNHDKKALEEFGEKHREAVRFYEYIQFLFFRQWRKLKQYANHRGIEIIGDLPIYIARDSADAWATPEILLLDENKEPKVVGGCPPDGFSDDGQLWGNPIYNWAYEEKNGFPWWTKRIEINLEFFDVIRLDHFIGFRMYWAVPYGDETARYGKWLDGPGMSLFNALKEKLGELPIIVEDLGLQDDRVIELKREAGFPGMAVLQFGFFPDVDNDYIPHNIGEDTIVYTGTHDNETTRGWIEGLSPQHLQFVKDYLNLTEEEGYTWGMIRGAMMSRSRLCIVPMQDYLNLGNEARMNEPSTLGKNWKFRVRKSALTNELADKIRHITKTFGRES